MVNGLRNAGFLDGTEGWIASAGSPAVDEDTIGAPGRAVFALAGTTGGTNVTVYLSSDTDNAPAVAPGAVVEVFGQWFASAGVAALMVEWRKSDDSTISVVTVPQVFIGYGEIAHGVREGFNRSRGLLTAPALTAKARVRLSTTIAGSGTAYGLGLMKPFLAIQGDVSPARWDPGTHENADLSALPAWPDVLPFFLAASQAQPFPNRNDFTGDDGVPSTGLATAEVLNQFTGQMRLSNLQLAKLSAFYRAGAPLFFVTRPDTDELCLASWLSNGAPTVNSSRGPWRMVQVGLKLRVA